MKTNILLAHSDMLGKLALIAVFALGVSLVFAPSKGAATTRNEHRLQDALAKAPEKERAKINPLAGDSNAPAAGRKLFEQHCAECHGRTAEGGKKAPSLRSETVQQATPGTLFWILTNGVVRRGMPVWSKLPEPQRWQIVTFLKSLSGSARTAAPRGQNRDR